MYFYGKIYKEIKKRGDLKLAEIFELFMVLSFGFSWPLSIIKSYKVRTAKGKSLFFLFMILFGYVCGILAKILSGAITYVFIFYVINLFMVATDIILYFRNLNLDKQEKLDTVKIHN